MGWWWLIWGVVLCLAGLPVLVFAAQVRLACRARDNRLPDGATSQPEPATRPRIAVLVPAHNEAGGIAATLTAIRSQLSPHDHLLVVADNCTDDTADAARRCGAAVTERHDTIRRGKGYALDHGVRHLAGTCHADVVIVMDADCTPAPGALPVLAAHARALGRPVQALYLMHAPEGAGLKIRIAAFAWIVRNHVRPLGWHMRHWPCQLMGTGMAFPWPLLSEADLATGHIVEDMQLGIALARAGRPPHFEPTALVSSVFPSSEQALQAQRTRWEHGHLGSLLGNGPSLLWTGLRQRDAALSAMALDLCVPPLASLALLLLLVLLASAAFGTAGGGWAPMGASLAWLGLFAQSVIAAWRAFGREALSAHDWMALPAYVLGKVPMYLRFLGGKRQQTWVRTARDHDQPR